MANQFTLVTDSSCDMSEQYLAENEVTTMQLSFTMNEKTMMCKEMGGAEFYAQMRAGGMPITAQVNVDDATGFLEPLLQSGRDVLYLAFSSGLSGTCASGQIAAAELRQKYPDRKLIVVDSLCASMGQGLFVHKAVAMRNADKSIDEVARWAEENKLRVAHYVVVDDLMHLHRGGRVSKTSAVLGAALGIKPLIHMDDEGKLVVIDKVRGRKQALEKAVMLLAGAVGEVKNDVCFISHSDCLEDAQSAAAMVRGRLGVKEVVINYIGPVIGAHTGVGTVALFLMAEHR